MNILRIQNISKTYSDREKALVGFSLNIQRGTVLSIVGESGSGKSTLLRIVAGLEVQDHGTVHFGDLKIQNPEEKLVPGYDEIQLVHQEYRLYPNSTVEENISRPLLQYEKSYRKSRVEYLLDLLTLKTHRKKLPKQLSGGQQQKVAIGRALSLEPEVLLLDEPFSSLDTIQRRELISELKELLEDLKITVLFVTHDLDDALQMSDELCILQKGKIIQMGKAEEIFRKPKSIYAAKLFSHLNKIPNESHAYIRPSDIELFRTKGIKAKITDRQYLIHYNQLTVLLSSGESWKVEDKKRAFEIGQHIFLKYDPSNLIYF
ncbi:ABC transporter ATP-binding protein [Pararhodonellum marinum]|uniref:ABC transporter ATP-binding protein n=1 Tax=Pararhodonellum marinum TaxID=2755358 RepID=UPI00188F700F|nr:ABC transporter ATP-binding protein [Pararhodonellum marinum]